MCKMARSQTWLIVLASLGCRVSEDDCPEAAREALATGDSTPLPTAQLPEICELMIEGAGEIQSAMIHTKSGQLIHVKVDGSLLYLFCPPMDDRSDADLLITRRGRGLEHKRGIHLGRPRGEVRINASTLASGLPPREYSQSEKDKLEALLGEPIEPVESGRNTTPIVVNSNSPVPPTPEEPPEEPRPEAKITFAFDEIEKAARACGVEHPEGLGGRVEIEYEILPSGQVKRAAALPPLKGSPLAGCVTKAFEAYVFPASIEGHSGRREFPTG